MGTQPGRRYLRATSIFVAICASLSAAAAAQVPGTTLTPDQLVREVVRNEIADANNSSPKHMFRSRKQTPKGSQTKIYVETNDAMAGMLIAINDHPLTPEQHQGELNHLAWLEANPDQLHKKQVREKEDSEHTLRIVRALPDAFHYQYLGAENGGGGLGREGAQLVRLKFTPNPAYNPPSHVEQVLAGMEGYLLIDTERLRIARIDGTLFKEVTFGWGIVGHLDKGGHFRVQQGDVGDGSWEITAMSLNITGKILFFKTLSMISDEVFSDFRRVPDNLPFAQGVRMLKAEEEALAREEHAPQPSEARTPHQ